MPMPDFSFLQNQTGVSNFGQLAQGLAQGANLGMQLQNAASQRKLALAQMDQINTEMGLKNAQFQADYLAKAMRDQKLAEIDTQLGGLTGPDRLKQAAIAYGSAGLTEEANKAASAYKDLITAPPEDKTPFTIPLPDVTEAGQPGKRIAIKQPGQPGYEDELTKRFGLPGYKISGVTPATEQYDPLAKMAGVFGKSLTDTQEQNKQLLYTREQIASLFNTQEGISAILPGFEGAISFGVRLMDALGAPISGADKLTASDAGVKAMAAQLMKLFGGSDTEREFGWTLDTLPQLLQDEVGRTRVMTDLLKLTDRKFQLGKLQEQFLGGQIRGTVPADATLADVMENYIQKNPLRGEESPVKRMLIDRGALTAEVAAEAERRLATAIKADPKNKDAYVTEFVKRTHYLPSGY